MVFAHAPVVFAVSPNLAGFSSLTAQQILDIYAGRLRNWQEVGGHAGTIYVMNREEGDSSRSTLEASLPGFKEVEPVGERVFTTPDAVKTLQTYPNTIGYLPITAAVKTGLTILRVNNVQPGETAFRDGRYPHAVPLGFVWLEEPHGALKDFLAYVAGNAGGVIIREAGAIPAK